MSTYVVCIHISAGVGVVVSAARVARIVVGSARNPVVVGYGELLLRVGSASRRRLGDHEVARSRHHHIVVQGRSKLTNIETLHSTDMCCRRCVSCMRWERMRPLLLGRAEARAHF